jgi:hypothetical protein
MLRKYNCGTMDIQWPSRLRQWKNTRQDAQKVRPARPQRVKTRDVPSGYVEGLNNARTMLADFFSILLACCHNDGPSRIIHPGYHV